jgi:hypothetical protein
MEQPTNAPQRPWRTEDPGDRFRRACPRHQCDLLITADDRLWCPEGHVCATWVVVDDDTDRAFCLVRPARDIDPTDDEIAVEMQPVIGFERAAPSRWVEPPMAPCARCGELVLQPVPLGTHRKCHLERAVAERERLAEAA